MKQYIKFQRNQTVAKCIPPEANANLCYGIGMVVILATIIGAIVLGTLETGARQSHYETSPANTFLR